MVKKIILMHHAASIKNNVDSELNHDGINMAKKLEGKYDIVIVSPYKKCFETLILSEIKYKILRFSILSTCKKDKEADKNFCKRMESFIEEISAYSKLYSNILVITHQDVIEFLTNKNINFGESVEYQDVEEDVDTNFDE